MKSLLFRLLCLSYAACAFCVRGVAQSPPDPTELLPGLSGAFYEMAPEELNVPAGGLIDFPVIGAYEKPLFARAEATANIPYSPAAPPGLSLEDNFFVRWTGYIRVEQEGRYTFAVESDDGARLYINGKLVVNNGGTHLVKEEVGRETLKRGEHALRIEYFDATRDAVLKVSWGAEGQERRPLSQANLLHLRQSQTSNEPRQEEPGLWAEYFDFRDGAFPAPSPERLPLLRRVDSKLDFPRSQAAFGGTELRGHFFARWTGFIKINVEGHYTFYTHSDDGSRLFVDGRLIVNNNGPHIWQEAAGSLYLRPGLHPFVVEYFDVSGESGLQVFWTRPWRGKELIPSASLFHRKTQE
jgi:hypothetical protein